MTLREWIKSSLDWADVFWRTVSSESVLDWPLSYFAYILIFGFVALVAFLLIVAVISDTLSNIHRQEKYRTMEAERLAKEDAEMERQERENRALSEHAKWRESNND
ncbi:hypothetical protein [Paracoccus alcaliphilus]|uniref:hypothetical protein n=1 Tax=Paracoccus alcaliphilus TaxID=34002 RepID=UPI001113AD3C|nr:hypothetical protein [Paracoccus alcaliphilus]WCR17364.1 hypothetical protein JHW40_13585 [Paracoccus alcaliphilus]